jgi:hypothetical protein
MSEYLHYLPYGLGGALLLTWLVGAVLFRVLFKRIRYHRNQLNALHDEVLTLVEGIHGMSAGALGQSEHLAWVEKELQRVRSRIETVVTNERSPESHNQAIRLAKRGSSSAQIQEECGLSRVEADLVVLLHGNHGESDEE